MHKVILVDHEERIRQQVQETVDWKRHGFKVIGQARTSREALSMHAELQPDLMVVELNMPVMDGLQVIEEIRRTDFLCHFIIISSHAEFSYAKTAISLGVNAYIVKPVDLSEVERELTRIGRLMQKRFELSVIDTRDLQIASLLGTRVKGKLPAALRTLRWPMYRVLLLKPYAMDSNSARPELIKLQLKRYFEKSGRGIVFHMNSKVGILLRETKEGFDGNRLFCDLEEALAVINTTFIAVAGGAVEEIANLWRSYSDAETLIKNEFLYRGERKVIDSSSIVRSQAALDLGMLSDKLCYAMDIGNRSILSRMLVEGLHAIAQFDGEEQAIKTAASQWISLSLTKLTKTNDEAYLAVQDVLSITSDIYIQPDYQTLVRMLEVRLMELLARIDSDRRDPVIKQLIDFIDRHYSENLKLETLAELFHYNSGYLGRLFKNATGDTFRTYLDKVRIESAKLLLESGLKVHQVASRVGISNVNYFNVKFKKYTGKKPSLFKAKLLRENECRQYGENT